VNRVDATEVVEAVEATDVGDVVAYAAQPGLWVICLVLAAVGLLVYVQLRRHRASADDYPPICTCDPDWCDWFDRTRTFGTLSDEQWRHLIERPICRACMNASQTAERCCREYMYM
jgi:hypothetical protein